MRGHVWTLVPHVMERLRSPRITGQSWSTQVSDERRGSVRLSGVLDPLDDARAIVVLVHGMGSCAEVSYIVRASIAARKLGMASLRLNLRGANGDGEDVYHGGLVDDLRSAISSLDLRRYDDIYVLGFSLGGHMVLRYALEPQARVRAVATICAPLDLDLSCRHIDALRQTLYRRHLLAGLRGNAQSVETRHGLRLSNTPLRSIRSIRDWDEQIVAPRFGFRDASDYYRQVSVGPSLGALTIPSLLMFGSHDPMVTPRDVQPSLQSTGHNMEVRWRPGGHVHFADSLGVIDEGMQWFRDCDGK